MTEPAPTAARSPMERRVSVAPGVSLHAEVRRGSAAPVVLVHGLASNLRLWDGVAERLHAAGHTVVAIDQRGHGRSDAPDTGYEIDTAVADLLALIQALGLERSLLVGQSWGGSVVLELASRHPAAVRGIACVDGGVADMAHAYPVWDDCLARLTPPTLTHLTMADLQSRIRAGVPHFSEDAVSAYLHCFRERADGTIEPRLTLNRHLEILKSLWEYRPSTRWATLEVPALLLLAGNDDEARMANKRRAEAHALVTGRKIRSVWFTPGHHDLHLESPERVADLLLRGMRDGFYA